MDQSRPAKDPNTAMVIEIVAGYLGLLGMGYVYAGRTATGLLRLFGFWAFLALVVIILSGLSLSSTLAIVAAPMEYESAFGASLLPLLCLLCLVPVILAVPVASGLMLKHSMS